MDAHYSPCARVLAGLNLTTSDAAIASNISMAAISTAKNGGRLPVALRVLLHEAGVDVCALDAEQTRWREAKGSAIRSRVMSGRGGDIPAAHKMVSGACNK